MPRRKGEKIRVLIAVVSPELDPVRDITPIRMGFSDLPWEGETLWQQEGPIVKAARWFFRSCTDDVLVYLLYTKLSLEGQRRRQERLERGIPGPRGASFEASETRTHLTQGYLANYLGIPRGRIRLLELPFDDEDPSNLNQWLQTIPKALNKIRDQLYRGREQAYEIGVLCRPGIAPPATAVLLGCLIGGLISGTALQAPDPRNIRQVDADRFEYAFEARQLVVNPLQREEELASEHFLTVFEYGDRIRVYLGGKELYLGYERENVKARLISELAKAWLGVKYTSRTHEGVPPRRIELPVSISKNYRSKLPKLTNESIKKHLEMLDLPKGSRFEGLRSKILREGFIQRVWVQTPQGGNQVEWKLNIPPEEIKLLP